MIKQLCLSTLLLAFPGHVLADDAFYFLLSSDTVLCLQENADVYAPANGEIAFIEAQNCGEADAASTSMSERVQNSAPEIVLSEEDGPDQIVAMASEDFACLISLDVPAGAPLLEFFPEECDLKVRD